MEITNETTALDYLTGGDNEQVETTPTVEPQAQEVGTTLVENIESQQTVVDNSQDNIDTGVFDLSDIDLSEYGITSNPVDPETIEQVAPQNNQLTELAEAIKGLQNPTATQPQETQTLEHNQELGQHNIPPEQAAQLTELFGQFQSLGLIPKTFGLTDEQQQLMDSVKNINDKLELQAQNEVMEQEFNSKVNALEEFSKSLETMIPGYDSKFMAQVVKQINQSNPEAGQKILNNPTELTKIWQKVGHKAQPQTQPTNVINTNTQTVNNNSDLESKVRKGDATPEEEGLLLMSL